MGQSGSSSAAVSEVPTTRKTVSRHVATFKKLYGELNRPEETGESANDDLFRVRPTNATTSLFITLNSVQRRGFRSISAGPVWNLATYSVSICLVT